MTASNKEYLLDGYRVQTKFNKLLQYVCASYYRRKKKSPVFFDTIRFERLTKSDGLTLFFFTTDRAHPGYRRRVKAISGDFRLGGEFNVIGTHARLRRQTFR